MDEHQTSAAPGMVEAIDAFWGDSPKVGCLKSIITHCVTNRGEAGALSLLDHEREEFDELGRLVKRLRYDDDGKLYRRERVVYATTGRPVRHFIELLDESCSFEWRYLADGPFIWASLIEADKNKAAVWGYRLDAIGRIIECSQEDSNGRFLGRTRAGYDGSGRLIELVCQDIDAPELRHLFEYGECYRKISWDGGPAGSSICIERYDEVDQNGNWLCLTELTYRDGREVGEATRYERETEYGIFPQ